MLKLVDIIKEYPIADDKVSALKKVNVSFRENEFVAVLGPSGCGKTTLLNIVGGLDRYTSGDLVINGKSTKKFRDHDWDTYRNHSIGFVFQSYNLIPHLTVLGNVELSLTISGVSKEERRKRAEEVLTKVGLGDQFHKKPNQMSGGQMQRVAIARALINNPDIILADEPTGALDTQTSVQIMELLKEVAKEKLVIMVTHNPNLANQYANRIISLLDGEIIGDTNPYHTSDIDTIEEGYKKRTSMSFFTALSLSLKNLFTKKFRTILTAFAGSIGIIGIALVLSVSNGFNKYIDKMQQDTLSSYPLTVSDSSMDFAATMQQMQAQNTAAKFPKDRKIFINDIIAKMQEAVRQNNITQEYIDHIDKLDSNLVNGVRKEYGLNLARNIYVDYPNFGTLSLATIAKTTQLPLAFSEILDSTKSHQDEFGFVKTQYTILDEADGGRWPTAMDEIVVVVDQYNQLTDIALTSIGKHVPGSATKEYTFDEIKSWTFQVVINDHAYVKNAMGENFFDLFTYKNIDQNFDMNAALNKEGNLTLKVVGIVRPNEETSFASISPGIGYTRALTEYLLEKNSKSEIASFMKNNDTHPLVGESYPVGSEVEAKKQLYREIGGDSSPNSFAIYAKDFKSKQEVKKYLDSYNVGKQEEDKVIYSDMMELMIDSVNILVNAISIVLICFTAISLIVSSVMIAIITYVSVIERTKEIGVLRSIGARKKDISRVFNAETFIIGLIAGTFGVLVALTLSFPISFIVYQLVEINGIAQVTIGHAISLITVSVLLTLFAGFIPSKIAAKKDPVVALRTE